MIIEDLRKVRKEAEKSCKEFLKFINENYMPAEKKLTLTDEMLKDSNLTSLMRTKFAIVFSPDKNVNEPKQV